MEWCSNCSMDVRSERENAIGSICCSECGRVIYQDEFRDEPTIFKGAGVVSQVSGNYVRSIQSDYSRSLENGKMQITDLMAILDISDGSSRDKANIFYEDVVCGENAYQDIKNSGRSSTPESITAPATGKLRELCEEKVQGDENAPAVTDESDNLSDIDDIEVYRYLHSEEDVELFRKIMWEEMNNKFIHVSEENEAPAPAPGPQLKINYELLDKLFDQTVEMK